MFATWKSSRMRETLESKALPARRSPPGPWAGSGLAATHLHGQPQLLDPVLALLGPGPRLHVISTEEEAPHQEARLALLGPVPDNLRREGSGGQRASC